MLILGKLWNCQRSYNHSHTNVVNKETVKNTQCKSFTILCSRVKVGFSKFAKKNYKLFIICRF